MRKNAGRLGLGMMVGLVLLMSMFSIGIVPTPAEAAIVAQWTPGMALNESRSEAVVVQDDDGLVYVIGGISERVMFTPLANASTYDVDTGEWKDITPMPQSTRGAAGAYLDGKIYVFGGYSAGWLSTTQIYDVASDAWSSGASLPEALWEAKACAGPDGMIYVFGGKTVAWAHRNTVNIYNPETDGWTTGTNMPAGLSGGAVAASGSYIYYTGGETGGGATTSVYRYYVWGNSWASRAAMPRATTAHAAVMGMDGMLYVFGGGPNEGESAAGTNWSYYYEPWDNAWHDGPNMTRNCIYLSGVATVDGRVLAIGGHNTTEASKLVDSMRVMSYSLSIAPSTVATGRPVIVTVTADFANAMPANYEDNPYLVSGSGTYFDDMYVAGPFSGTFAFQMDIPDTAAPGAYEVVLPSIYILYEEGGSITLPEQRLALTVVVGDTLDEQIEALQNEIAALQLQLVEANGNVTAILMTLAVLGATFTDLQTQLDAMQDQVNRIEDKADTAGTYAVINMVLVIIIVVLLALMFVMSRRKP